jgi:pSer/pThr/pTyr-binding forkhead associated (FHA) protein
VQTSDIHVLHFVHGKYQGEEFPLGPDESYIAGRSPEADIVLADDTVSRKHARFYQARDLVWVRDLGSRNGTQVNGSSVEHHCLQEGDRIVLGSSLARVTMVPASQVTKRGRRSEDSAARSMTGSLQDIPLADVLQWLATSRKTGMLKVHGNRDGALHLRNGQVYYANIEGSEGLDPAKALLRMLVWTDGTFELDSASTEEVPTEISTPLEHLLMEAARIQDELAHLGERTVLPIDPILLASPSGKAWRELAPEQLDLLQALAEGKTWTDILDGHDSDDLTVTKQMVELHQAGVVSYGD